MLNKKVRLTAIASAILGITTQGAVAHELATSPEDDSLETIAVYGEKANRKLKDTTSSVSVITEKVLKSLQHISISSTVADIPNSVVYLVLYLFIKFDYETLFFFFEFVGGFYNKLINFIYRSLRYNLGFWHSPLFNCWFEHCKRTSIKAYK